MYYDPKGNIRKELLDREAFEQARKFFQYKINKKTGEVEMKKGRKVIDNNARKTLSLSQLRRFYNECRQLERKVESEIAALLKADNNSEEMKKEEGFSKIKPLIKMVKAKAAYAANPSNPKIPEVFKKFLQENIDRIETYRDFKTFMLYFEAVVGFYYGFEGVKND